MTLIDLLLNVVALLVWTTWRSGTSTGGPVSPFSLLSTLKSTRPAASRWIFPATIGLLIVMRTIFYWQMGSRQHWIPVIAFGPVHLAFRSDVFTRIFLFSILSFLATLGLFYFSLLFFAIVNHRTPSADPQQRLVRRHLGWIDGIPWLLKWLLPMMVAILGWCSLYPFAHALQIVPPIRSFTHLVEQGVVVGLGIYLLWKYIIAAVVVLHLLNTYIYMGHFSIWSYLGTTTRILLRPTGWIPLRMARVDFAPLLAIALVFLSAEFADRGLVALYKRLPF